MLLSRRIRRLSVPFRSRTKPFILVLYAASQYFFPLSPSSIIVRRCSALENAPSPVLSRISSALPLWELKYLSCADVSVFSIPSTVFLTGLLLRALTMGERVFFFQKKIRGKKNPESFTPLLQTRLACPR